MTPAANDEMSEGKILDDEILDDEILEGITIEQETRGDPGSLFRVFVNHRLIGDCLTAAQVHGLVGDILERVTLNRGVSTIPLEQLNAGNDE
jgi:hypothetical protein